MSVNKHQEALDSLRKECKATYNEKGKRWYTSDKTKDERCNLLQELVDKEIPMKPYINKVSMIDTCSNCHEPIVFINNHIEPKRCIECGQVIDWSDEY